MLVLFFVTSGAQAQVACSPTYSFQTGPYPWIGGGTKEHNSGEHIWEVDQTGICTYSTGVGTNCDTDSQARSSIAYAIDEGSLQGPPPYYHVPGYSTQSGRSDANGAGATSDTAGAAAYEGCHLPGCQVSVSISGSGHGLGFSFSFPPVNVFSDKSVYTRVCTTMPPSGGGGGGGGGGGCCLLTCSPIVVDTTGGGFHFTDPTKNCILFDLKNTGSPICLSWPVHGSGNAWLVYDRDGDGIIDTGNELFGNTTPQPDFTSITPNGFNALAEFNLAKNGGNGDLVLDKQDSVWPQLKLWIDEHCYLNPQAPCTSQPSELHTLAEFQIYSIGLIYDADQKYDQVGNLFRFYAFVNPAARGAGGNLNQTSADGLQRRIYDVYLTDSSGQGNGECK